MLGRGSYPNNMGTVQAKVVNHENNNHKNTAKENIVCKNPKASGNDGDDGHGDVQPSNRSLDPPIDFSNAVTGENDEKENHHDEGDDYEDEEDDDDEEEDHRDAAAHDEDQTKEDYNREEDDHEGDNYEDDEEDDDDDTNNHSAAHDKAEGEEDEEEDTRAAASTKSTAETGTAPREPPISNASLTSGTEVTDIPEEARGVTSLPPESRPRNGPAPSTVQVENALAVQVGNGNVLSPARTEESENATPASCGEACQPHIGAATVAVYINNCGVVQVGNHNRVVIEEVTPKVTPQENAFVRVCCELDIDPESGDHIHERLSHEDVRRQFAKKMAESFKVTCKIRSATKGCILLELEVPTEEDRLQLLRMARDGTFQQVLLETFLPEFAAEGRAVTMNLAIGVRNPSQAMVEELQGAVASNSHETIKMIEIPNGVSPDTVDAAVPEQPEPHPGQAESSEQPEYDTGSVEDSPDVGQRDAPVSPDVDRRPASDTDDISKLTSLMRVLSDPGDAEDETRQEETTASAVGDVAMEESNADTPASEDNNDQHIETYIQRLETDVQHLETDDQRPDTYEATCPDLSAHPEASSDVTTSKVFERSRSQETGDEETSKLLRRLALALDRREWRQVAQALRVQQPDIDLSAGDTDLRIRVLRDWQRGPSYGEQFDKLLLTLEACGRDDFAVELLQSAPQTIYTTSSGSPIRAVAETPSGEPTQVRETAQVFKQPKKPRKPPVDLRTPLRRMPYTLMKKISMELDPPGPLVGWRDVASHAGYSMQEIRVFDMEYLRPDGSPTRALLQAWGTRNATIQDLETALRQTGLLNVAEMLAPDQADDEDV